MDKQQIREFIAKRAALEVKNGDVLNLGIGIPTLIASYIPKEFEISVQFEDGFLGRTLKEQEPIDPHWVDAGGKRITPAPGGAAFSSETSFIMIRGGHINTTFLGALEVDEKGNLANWSIPGQRIVGMGGAMDLLSGAKRVIVTMEHTAKGTPKILKQCRLPLTAEGKVNMIITEMGVMLITPRGIELTEINHEFTVEQVQAVTEAELIVSSSLKQI